MIWAGKRQAADLGILERAAAERGFDVFFDQHGDVHKAGVGGIHLVIANSPSARSVATSVMAPSEAASFA